MSTDCSPIIANLFLCCYVTVYDKIPKDPSKHDLMNMFNNTFRYLSDVLTLNNPEFQKFAKNILKNLP